VAVPQRPGASQRPSRGRRAGPRDRRAALRRIGAKRLETWLRNRRVVRPDRLAEIAVQAAERQHTSLPGEKLAAQLVHTQANEVMGLNQQVAELDKNIEARFCDHHAFDVITSMPFFCRTGWSAGLPWMGQTGEADGNRSGPPRRSRHSTPSRGPRRTSWCPAPAG